jgi:hypothetical protein
MASNVDLPAILDGIINPDSGVSQGAINLDVLDQVPDRPQVLSSIGTVVERCSHCLPDVAVSRPERAAAFPVMSATSELH